MNNIKRIMRQLIIKSERVQIKKGIISEIKLKFIFL